MRAEKLRRLMDKMQSYCFIFLVIAYMKSDLSPTVYHSSLSQLISSLSLSAINFLNSSRTSSCLLLLSSLLLLDLPSSLRSSLLNHLGCYYKRTQNYKKALQCFKEAITKLMEAGEKIGIAMGQMNICSLYSQIGEQVYYPLDTLTTQHFIIPFSFIFPPQTFIIPSSEFKLYPYPILIAFLILF